MSYAIRFYPLAGVVVYEGETDDEAFRRVALLRARQNWEEAQRAVEAEAAALPWWEEVLPEGRT